MDKPKWTDVAIVILTVGIVFLAIMQWWEMHSGGVDTHDLAVAAGKQADAARALGEQAKLQADGTRDLSVAAGKQAQQAERSSKIAERTLGILETQQRAWVALAASPALQPAGNGVIWSLRNFGNSTAFHIAAKGEIIVEQSAISKAQDRICQEVGTSQIWELLFPGVTGRPRAAFAVGTPINYVVGCIRYRDQFSVNRWTRFCYEPYGRDPDTFIACFADNSTDADEKKQVQNPN